MSGHWLESILNPLNHLQALSFHYKTIKLTKHFVSQTVFPQKVQHPAEPQ